MHSRKVSTVASGLIFLQILLVFTAVGAVILRLPERTAPADSYAVAALQNGHIAQ